MFYLKAGRINISRTRGGVVGCGTALQAEPKVAGSIPDGVTGIFH
jgi:hypothetical protein